MDRKAKIVATIGPASQDEVVLERLILAGVNVARMNFSHGTHEEHAERIAIIRRISEKLNKPVGILQDLQGPKIRVGELPAPSATLRRRDHSSLCNWNNAAFG